MASDGSLQSEDVLSSITQITSTADSGKEPIQAQSLSLQSTARKKPIQSQSNSSVEMPLRNVKARLLKEEEEEGSSKERVGDIKEKRLQDDKEEILRWIDRIMVNSVSQTKKDILAALQKQMIVKAIEPPDHI